MPPRVPEIVGLLALGVVSRLVPHVPNMTAIGAVALKSRARFGMRGLLIPLISMLFVDAIIGFYSWKLLLSVYASIALVSLLGALLKAPSILRILVLSTLGSFVFFGITNTVVWATSLWYPHTITGLLACYLAGLPFLFPMLAGDIIFSLTLFRVSLLTPAVHRAIFPKKNGIAMNADRQRHTTAKHTFSLHGEHAENIVI